MILQAAGPAESPKNDHFTGGDVGTKTMFFKIFDSFHFFPMDILRSSFRYIIFHPWEGPQFGHDPGALPLQPTAFRVFMQNTKLVIEEHFWSSLEHPNMQNQTSATENSRKLFTMATQDTEERQHHNKDSVVLIV